MTDLEQAVANTLRLSTEAAESLLPTIRRNITAARAELIRSGCNSDAVQSDGALVEDAIITFCLVRMGDETMRERYQTAFESQQENLRKS